MYSYFRHLFLPSDTYWSCNNTLSWSSLYDIYIDSSVECVRILYHVFICRRKLNCIDLDLKCGAAFYISSYFGPLHFFSFIKQLFVMLIHCNHSSITVFEISMICPCPRNFRFSTLKDWGTWALFLTVQTLKFNAWNVCFRDKHPLASLHTAGFLRSNNV